MEKNIKIVTLTPNMAQIKHSFAEGFIGVIKRISPLHSRDAVPPNTNYVAAAMQDVALLAASREISFGEERSAIEDLSNSTPNFYARDAGKHAAYTLLSGAVFAVGAAFDVEPQFLEALMVSGGFVVGTYHALSTIRGSLLAWSTSRRTQEYDSIDDVAQA